MTIPLSYSLWKACFLETERDEGFNGWFSGVDVVYKHRQMRTFWGGRAIGSAKEQHTGLTVGDNDIRRASEHSDSDDCSSESGGEQSGTFIRDNGVDSSDNGRGSEQSYNFGHDNGVDSGVNEGKSEQSDTLDHDYDVNNGDTAGRSGGLAGVNNADRAVEFPGRWAYEGVVEPSIPVVAPAGLIEGSIELVEGSAVLTNKCGELWERSNHQCLLLISVSAVVVLQ